MFIKKFVAKIIKKKFTLSKKRKIPSERTLLGTFAEAFVDFSVNIRYQKLCPQLI